MHETRWVGFETFFSRRAGRACWVGMGGDVRDLSRTLGRSDTYMDGSNGGEAYGGRGRVGCLLAVVLV